MLPPFSIRVDNDGGKKQMQIPVDEQHKLFQWILEEKRKVKPVSESDKARIDEEKALLKHFIRTKHIPPL
ncbi:hypothetical protein O6H91_06G113100 [Diphasiastrum complanatum]|nr:hypothetical protein O6H91_06G113100 [Diphasiastrum complanatum]